MPRSRPLPRSLRLLAACALLPAAAAPFQNSASVPKWTRFEVELQSPGQPEAPLEADVTGIFRAPSGASRTVPGFWDGGRTWRVRFAPDEEGRWTWQTRGPAPTFQRQGEFRCTAPRAGTVFEQKGPLAVSADRRRLAHRDGTPFFWLADTAWNGPLHSTPADWEHYLAKRASQGFTAIQWVATQWRGSTGDAEGRPAYTGHGPIRVNVAFFQRLEQKHAAILKAGMLSVPVMLWAIQTRNGPEVNPGLALPERDAALLARYQLARWGADPVVWLLNGDGDYRGPRAERWRTIGRAAFAGLWHAPVSLHSGGRMWVMDEFRSETWLDLCGYQSAHADSDGNSAWIHSGPPAQEWTRTPAKPVMSLEAPYDRPPAPGGIPIDFLVRRNHLWSLLNAPPAGITYGVHGVWGWSDGVHPALGHGATVWPDWKTLLDLPGALQIARIRRVLEASEWTRLMPAPAILAEQPGAATPRAFIAAAQTASKDSTVVYSPESREVLLHRPSLPASFQAEWVAPATGERLAATGAVGERGIVFAAPAPGDWLLLLRAR